jgi:hemerythrin-like metal-binding protein
MSQFEIFPWNSNFETGIELIDEQHKELVRLLNTLVSHIAKGSDPPMLEEIIQQLNDYVIYHFSAEEDIWRSHFEGDVWFKWHHQSHDDFIHEIEKVRCTESSKPLEETLLGIVKFLTHWLARHILDSDRRMAKVVLAMPTGVSLAMAKEAADAEMSGAAKVLVDTLMNMYDRLADSTVEMAREIQRRQKAEVELIQAKSVLEKGSQAKSIYLANLSHELRTPLNTILGYVELMRQDEAVSRLARAELEVVQKSGDYLLTVINDVLEIAKIEAGHIQVEMAPVDLDATVAEVFEMFQLLAQERRISLVQEPAERRVGVVLADGPKIRQILINLVSNAVKATRDGVLTVRLSYGVQRAGCVLIEVEDTGIGIAEGDFARIFVPFEQAAQSGDGRGTGLGLAICKEFAAIMSGEIGVRSTLGKGSVFSLTLPAEEVSTPVSHDMAARDGAIVRLAQGQESVRVLVVDDDHDHRTLLARILRGAGFDVQCAEDGVAAVACFKEWSPQFIWMDERMPVMHGRDAARKIRQMAGVKSTKIALLTASIFALPEAGSLEFDAVLHKPFLAQQVFESMGTLLGLRFDREPPPTSKHRDARPAGTAVAALPPSVVSNLSNAITTLSQHAIFAAIEDVRAIDAPLAEEFMQMAKCYEYEAMLSKLV